MRAEINEEQIVESLKNNENCLLCYDRITASNHNNIDIFKTCTSLSATPVSQIIGHILEAEITKDITHSDYICEMCFEVINEVDKIETRLTQIRNEVRKTYICTLNILINVNVPIVTNAENLTPAASAESSLPLENVIGTQITQNWVPIEDVSFVIRDAENVNTTLSLYSEHTNIKQIVDKCTSIQDVSLVTSMQDVSSVTTVTKSINGITASPLHSKHVNVKQVTEKYTSVEDIPFITTETQNINTTLAFYSEHTNDKQVVDKCASIQDVSLATAGSKNSLPLNYEYMNAKDVTEKCTSTKDVTSVITEADDIISAAVKLSLLSEDVIVKQVADKWIPVYDQLDSENTESVNSSLSFSYRNANVGQTVEKWTSMNDVLSVMTQPENVNTAAVHLPFSLEDMIVNQISEKWTSVNDVTSVTTEMENINTSAMKLSLSSENTSVRQITEKWTQMNSLPNTGQDKQEITFLVPDCQAVKHHSRSSNVLPNYELFCLDDEEPNSLHVMEKSSKCTSGNELQTLLVEPTAKLDIGNIVGSEQRHCDDNSSVLLEGQLNTLTEGSKQESEQSCETSSSKRNLMNNIVKIKYCRKILENVDGKFVCLVCVGNNNIISDICSISAHMKSEHDISVFICQICGYYFEKHSDIIQHLDEHAILNGKCLNCNICNSVFDNIELFRVHNCMYNTQNTLQTCETCGIQCNYFNHIESHDDTRIGTSPNTLNFAQKYLATEHQKIQNEVTKLQVFDCKNCEKSFLNEKVLTQQSKIHCDSAPFTCHICGMLFCHKSEVRLHVKIHTGKNVFQCDSCDMIFDHNKTLMSHKKLTIHKTSLPNT